MLAYSKNLFIDFTLQELSSIISINKLYLKTNSIDEKISKKFTIDFFFIINYLIIITLKFAFKNLTLYFCNNNI